MSRMELIERPSPNFDERKQPISMIVLHYTGMQSAAAAIDLQRAVGPEMVQRPAVRAMIEAGWAVLLDFGRGGTGRDETLDE